MDLEEKVKWAEREDKDANPLEFYKKHYPEMTRGKLSIIDHGLYERLRINKLLGHVPKKKIKIDNFSTVVNQNN